VVASLGATDDETAKLLVWDAATRARDGPPLDLGGTVEDPPPDIQLLDNTTLLAAGRSASIWNLASRRRIRRLPGGPAEPVAASPDGRTAALGRPDSSIDIVDLATGAHRATLPGHGVQLHGIAFSPDGASLAVGNDDRTATVWDLASGQIRETLRGHAGRVFKPAFSRDSQTLYTASLDGSVMVWDLAGSRRLGQPFTRAWAPVSWSAVQPGGAMAATGHYDGTVTLWDTAKRAPMGRPLRAHDGEVRSLMFAQSGRTLVTTGQDGNVIRWEMPAGRRIGQPLRGHTAGVGAGILSPDERLLATAADDGLINLWDAATGKLLRTLYRHPGAVFDLAFSPDGTMLGAAGEGKDAVVLRVADGVVLQRLQADRRDVHTIVFSPDGRTIATGGNAGKVLLWIHRPAANGDRPWPPRPASSSPSRSAPTAASWRRPEPMAPCRCGTSPPTSASARPSPDRPTSAGRPSLRPTGAWCPRSRMARCCSGTWTRPHGRHMPVRWPAATSPDRNGRSSSPDGRTERSAPGRTPAASREPGLRLLQEGRRTIRRLLSAKIGQLHGAQNA
jgi:WD40 repeat protein